MSHISLMTKKKTIIQEVHYFLLKLNDLFTKKLFHILESTNFLAKVNDTFAHPQEIFSTDFGKTHRVKPASLSV